MQLTLKSVGLALVALSAFVSASHSGHKNSGDGRRLMRKRASAAGLAGRGGLAPIAEESHDLVKRDFSGQATFYDPSVGPGHCGQTFQKTDPIVAVNSAQFKVSLCFTWITVTANGKTARAQITDSCPSCAYGALDFSPAVFNQFATPDDGVFQMSWVFGSGSSSSSSSNDEDDDDESSSTRRTSTTSTTPTSTWTPPKTTSTPSSTRRTSTRTTPTTTSTSSDDEPSSSRSSSSSSSTRTTSSRHTSTSSATLTSTSASDTEATSSAAATSTEATSNPVPTLGDDSDSEDNNLGLLGEAVGGFAKLAQVINDNSDSL